MLRYLSSNNKRLFQYIWNSLFYVSKVSGAKPREDFYDELTSQVKVFGESREPFAKGSLGAGGSNLKNLAEAP